MTPVPEASSSGGDDVLSRLAGVIPDSPLGRLLAQRPDIVHYAESSYRALLEPDDVGGLSRAERELVALRVANLTGTIALANWHRERLAALGAGEATFAAVEGELSTAPFSPRELAILAYIDRVSSAPATATAEQLAELRAAGLTPRDIVVLGQIAGFLAFQSRALHGLRLLAEGV